MKAKSFLILALSLLLFACDSSPASEDIPPAVEDTAFAIVEDLVAESLDSRSDSSGAYQHSDLTINRLEDKALAQDAIDDGITGLWCAGVSYQIAPNDGENAGEFRDAELIVLVFEQGAGNLGGGEWVLQFAEAEPQSISEYNDLAYQECLGR